MTIPDKAIKAAERAWQEAAGDTLADWLRAALAAAEQAMWEPIESAPRDTTILAQESEGCIPVAIRWQTYSAEDREEIGEDGYWAFCDDVLNYAAPEGPEPTLWRPLPPPPEMKK